MSLVAGMRFGSFEILSPLGAGGMGEVYRARDTRLDRHVAIKVLLDSFARDPERLARFEREAKLLASLNHPHIAQIYGIEEGGGTKALVIELVDGPTLADRIAQGPVPLDEALPIARQIAEALEAAHEQGIIHRDLKPANIKIRSDGSVKVLDFGLAKLAEPAASSGSGARTLTMSPTMMSPAMTQAGFILGTAAYMSPEQARGRALDERTDIWAFGCVLFEMLTGRLAVGATDNVSDAIAGVLTREPEWAALPTDTPEPVRRLLRRCLSKDAARRLRHAGDVRIELDDAVSGSVSTDASTSAARSRVPAYLPWAVAAIASLLAAWAGWRAWGAAGATAGVTPTTRLELNLPAGVELYSSTSRTVAVAPDGKSFSFVGTSGGARMIYLRRLDRFEAMPIRGTEGATTSFFSPDGASIAFVTSAGELRTVSLTDGLVVTVSNEASLLYGAAWTLDDRLLFARGGALWAVGRAGGVAKPLTTVKAGVETVHGWPAVLPDGRTVLFAVQESARWHIESLRLDSGERRLVLPDATLPLLGPGGYLFFYRNGQLLAVPFDASTLAPSGPPIQALENVPDIAIGAPIADVSATGVLVYAPSSALRQLVWVSRQGVDEPVTETPRSYINPRLSPDGTRIVVQAGAIWVHDLRRNSFELVATINTEGNAFPMWLPDGRRVMHRSGVGLRVQGTDSGGVGVTLPGTTEFDYPASMTADGRSLLFLRSSAASNFDIFVSPFDDLNKAVPLVRSPAYEGGARLSPDGKWVVYVSNESGRNEIYVRSFSGPDRRRQVSTEGGTQPTWNANSREIFYRIGDRMMAVGVQTTADDIMLSPPQKLFERVYAYGAGITIANYDVTADGQRFLMVKDEATAGRLRMILNWSPSPSH
jgi:Tol biopolymer transport system component/tRNA A-37 threonylcarbamoyl transferase component Bud32